jgi:Big-like domain-containing protein
MTPDSGRKRRPCTVVPPNLPPNCSGLNATPNVLWPPNQKLIPVQIRGASDPDGDPLRITIDTVSQDEPNQGGSGGDAWPDATLSATGEELRLRASRNGSGDGRVYRVHVIVADGHGATCSGTITVSVPHDQSGRPARDSAPPGFNSFTKAG